MQKNKLQILTAKKFTLMATLLGLFLLSTGISWALFSYLLAEPTSTTSTASIDTKSRLDPSLPKTEACPINGEMFSRDAKEFWMDRRPITASIENHADSRPQSGLSFADVVYEVVAEGGITRFLSVFYCGASAQDVRIAPIRSARIYLINWATEYQTPIFVHVGGANSICSNCPGGRKPGGQVASDVDAFRALEKLGWRSSKGNAFDGGTNVGYPIIIRDQYRLGVQSAWEHSVVGFTDKIFDEAKIRGYGYEDVNGRAWDKNFISWKFADGKPLGSPAASNISFEFWSNKPDFTVEWKFDQATNAYLRFNGGKEHVDHETGKQLTAKNVVIQFVKERGPVDKEGHMFYTTIGKGKSLVFQNGDIIEGTWEKKTQLDRTRFFTKTGSEISFVRGPIWIEAVPDGNKIQY
jgi:hypothetical protein